MSKVKELLEREENFKNWTLDEIWELNEKVTHQWSHLETEKTILGYLNQATSFNEFKLLMLNSNRYGVKETPEDTIMSIWIDFLEGKDNSK